MITLIGGSLCLLVCLLSESEGTCARNKFVCGRCIFSVEETTCSEIVKRYCRQILCAHFNG